MDHTRLRLGEFVVAAAAIATLVLLFLHWQEADEVNYVLRGYGATQYSGIEPGTAVSGWSALGWFMDVLLLAAILGAFALVAAVASRRPVALPVGASVLLLAGASLVTLILAVRLLFLDDATTIAVAGLVTTALIPVGALISMRDERTSAPSSRRPLVPARPAPPA